MPWELGTEYLREQLAEHLSWKKAEFRNSKSWVEKLLQQNAISVTPGTIVCPEGRNGNVEHYALSCGGSDLAVLPIVNDISEIRSIDCPVCGTRVDVSLLGLTEIHGESDISIKAMSDDDG